MKLGKIQKAWVKSLRENPDRQTINQLGYGTPDNYKACCLGELLCVSKRMENKDIPFLKGELNDNKAGHSTGGLLSDSYEKFGLRSSNGRIEGGLDINGKDYRFLTSANDDGITWPQIADFIEANPEKIFTKSV